MTTTTEPCPACQAPTVYARELDRYVHEDGADNRTCWRAVSRGTATAPYRPGSADVLVDLPAAGIHVHLDGRPAIRATTNLMDTLARRIAAGPPTEQAAAFTAVLRYALAGARDSSAADGELRLTSEQGGLDGGALWAQLDPDGYVLMLRTDV
jgi:hypothetical protein